MTILEAVQSVGAPWLDRVAFAVTQLGSEFAYIGLLVVIYLAIDASAGRTIGLAVLGGYYLNQHAKAFFDTARPYVLHPELLRGGTAAAETGPGSAFPSGHAQSAATFWGLAAALTRRRWFTVLAVAVVLLVGTSRIYLGVHWPIDVLGGLVIGLTVVGVALLFARRESMPPAATVLLLAILPLAIHLVLPTPDSGRLAGAFAGIATAPLLVPHRARGPLGSRIGLAVLGLALALGWLLGTSALLPDAVKDHMLVAPLRYLLVAWSGVVLAPWLAVRTGWLPQDRRT